MARGAVITAATLTVSLSAELLRRWLKNQAEMDLDLVAYSARVIAAARAEEHDKLDALVKDPLAKALAGKRAMEERKAVKAASSTQAQQDSNTDAAASSANADSSSAVAPRKVTRIIMRTIFFDDAIMCALGISPVTMFKPLKQALGAVVCKQVVLLGSGLDSRPWRLDLPRGVSWFEVDQASLLAAKRAALRKMGARTVAAPASASSSSGDAKGFPLKCASWSGTAVDLQQAGWTQQLIAAGFKPDVPTAWVLEGLLYYMEPDTVPVMLREAAGVSAPGSVLLASIVSDDFVKRLQARNAARGESASPSRAAAQEGGKQGQAGAQQEGRGDSGSTAGGAGSKEGGRRSKQQGGGSIMSAWKWGCPEAPGTYFGKCGWQVLSNPTWTEVADVYELQPELPPGSSTSPNDRVRYVTCLLK